jgi:hypothetical protein
MVDQTYLTLQTEWIYELDQDSRLRTLSRMLHDLTIAIRILAFADKPPAEVIRSIVHVNQAAHLLSAYVAASINKGEDKRWLKQTIRQIFETSDHDAIEQIRFVWEKCKE